MTFADSTMAREALKEMYPQAKQITLVEHGYDNIVGLVDDKYAIRFPRNSNAYKRSLYEKEILKNVTELKSVEVPRLVSVKNNPPCLVTSYINGIHLRSKNISHFTLAEQSIFGKTIGRFAFELHSTLSVDETRGYRKKYGLDKLEEEPWPIYLKKTLLNATFPTLEQAELANKYYYLWKDTEKNENLVVVHDDLHSENMLFKHNKLSGVLDFGDTTVGTPEQEFRQLYRINKYVLQAAINEYSNLSGLQLNPETSKTWAIAQELASYSERLSTGNTQHPSFIRACKNLNKWLPEAKWGEGLI